MAGINASIRSTRSRKLYEYEKEPRYISHPSQQQMKEHRLISLFPSLHNEGCDQVDAIND